MAATKIITKAGDELWLVNKRDVLGRREIIEAQYKVGRLLEKTQTTK